MVEEVVGGGNVVEEASYRFRMEKIGFHRVHFPLPWERPKGRER